MIQGLRTVVYKVPDLEAAKAWYARVLGVEPYFAELGFRVGGFALGLDPDLEEGGRPGEGGIVVASVKDPFGNVFGIIQNPHFSPADVR